MSDQPGKSGLTVDEVIRVDLYGLPTAAQQAATTLPREYVAGAIRSAEDWLERELGTFFGIKRVASAPVERGLDPTTYDVAVPALNYSPEMWEGERWSYISADYRPVWDVTQFFFAFPGHFQHVWNAKEWVQVDHKFGHINIVPTGGTAVLAMFNAWVLSVLAGGRSLPRSLFMDYTAGFSADYLRQHAADLLDILRAQVFMTLLGPLSYMRTNGLASCSTSLDGLSQSESFAQGQYGPYSASYTIAKERQQLLLRTWKDTQRGVGPFVVI